MHRLREFQTEITRRASGGGAFPFLMPKAYENMQYVDCMNIRSAGIKTAQITHRNAEEFVHIPCLRGDGMKKKWLVRIAGGAAGFANGLFGGGGGMVFLPILSRWGKLDRRKLYATCVGVIFPVCVVSAAVYVFRGGVSLLTALPYLAGGLIGGWLGGKWYGRISTGFLKWLFAAFLFYAGVKYLL